MSVDRQTIAALREAIDDEYKARATYEKVIEKFGPVRPFVNIAESEQRHVLALLRQFTRLGVTPPRDKWRGRVQAPASLIAACKAGVESEIENKALYVRLLQMTGDPGVRRVMLRLQSASQDRHLPAFRRCLARNAGSKPSISAGAVSSNRCKGPRRLRKRRRRRGTD